MNKDNRISNLPEAKKLLSNLDPFPDRAIIPQSGDADSDALFLLTRSGSHNEKITYKNLKNSLLDNAVFLTGNQLISGEKTFADICTFQDTVYINEIIDITQTGDISGNIFVGETGLFEKVGIGLNFTDRRVIKDVFADFPGGANDYLSYGYGGGIDPQILPIGNHVYHLTSENGESYNFSGDATGLDPEIDVLRGDSLTFFNSVKPHTFSIKDDQGVSILSENSGVITFNLTSTGNFYYQCDLTDHENMSGDINVSNSNSYNYHLISGDGNNYQFSGDATGQDPNLQVRVGDSLTFTNHIGSHALTIRDSGNNIQVSEISNITLFEPTDAGDFYYQCSVSGHENMSGLINVSTGDTFNYYLTHTDGQNYYFSGAATGQDPSISATRGDTLIFENLIEKDFLTIKDSTQQILASETSGRLEFSASYVGDFYYQSSLFGHENASGIIRVREPEELGVLDFSSGSIPNTLTSLRSYPIYQPSGYYNSSIPQSQQNWGTDLSLDGHSLSPDEIHREMGGAWYQIDFDKPFNYKGFSIFRKELSNSAEQLKVVASNNGTDWHTIHRISGVLPSFYKQPSEPTPFVLENYYPEKYSKYRLVGEKIISGDFWEINHFNLSGVEFFEHVHTVDPLYNLHVSGTSCFLGDIFHTGDTRHKGDLLRIGDTNLSGDFSITGDSHIKGDVHIQGDIFLTGEFMQTGNSMIHGDARVTGNTHVGEYVFHYQDRDTHLRFRDDEISLKAGNDAEILIKESGSGNYISFTPNQNEAMRIVDNGFVGINTIEPIGELSVTGESYLECAFTTGQNGNWERIYGGSDEVVSFSTPLEKGRDNHLIDFPKTFGSTPAVVVSIENNSDSQIIPHVISGISPTQFSINFGNELPNEHYRLHINARPIGKSSLNKTTTQSFTTVLNQGSDMYEIFYPEAFHANPVISTTIETDDIVIPYIISGISQSSYHIIFGSNIKSDYKMHTHAVR